MKKTALILGSKSDLPVAEKAFAILDELGMPYEVRILSAHRCPDEAARFASSAREGGFSVLIAFAGMAAHLAGALAAHTTLPVIGVPCKGSCFDGLDAMLSTIMMPPGIPVAAVGVDAGKNAALLAAEIIGAADEALAERLKDFRTAETAKVLKTDEEVRAQYSRPQR